MRSSPAVKRELPPDSSSGARSSSSTRFAVSFADSAAHRAALPPPTTITSYSSLTDSRSFAVRRIPDAEKPVGERVDPDVGGSRPLRAIAQDRLDPVFQRPAVFLAHDVQDHARFDPPVAAGPQLRLAALGPGRPLHGPPDLGPDDVRITLERGDAAKQ